MNAYIVNIKSLYLVIVLFCLCLGLNAQINNKVYNKALADSLGADEFGMKQYIFVILKTGSFKTENKQLEDSLFRGHMSNINRLASDGKLIVAGPIKKNEKNYRGIFILNVKTFEEAIELVNMDPAIKFKLLDVELYQWYGSAALPEYLKVHKEIEKLKP